MTIWKGILIFFFSVLTSHVFPQGYNFRNFKSEDGLVQPYIYSIIQDVHGYLWVATGDELYRYNGFIFENFTASDTLAGNSVTSAINQGKDLWFGHKNGHLSYFNGKKFQAFSIPESSGSQITHFAKSPDEHIWVSTYSDGILKMSKDSGVLKHYLFKDQVSVITFGFIDDSELLVGTNTGLFYCRLKEPGEIEILRPFSEIPESKVTCIQKMRNKPGFYIATEDNGIFRLINEDNLLTVSKIIAGPDFDFNGIQDIYEDSQSNLWLGTFGNGLIKMIYSASGEFIKIIYFNIASGFITDNVKTVYEDREGNIWSGNFGQGLTQITSKTFSVIKFDNPFYGNNIFSFWFTQHFRWIGTENGLVKMDLLTNKVVKFYSKNSGLPKDTVSAIYSTDGNELWIGTEKNGVFRMEAGSEKIHKYPIGDGALENSVTIITGKKEQVWIGTKKGLWNINKGTGTKKEYSINQGGLPHNYINYLYLDTTDRLWVATRSNILAYIQDEKVFKTPFNPGKEIMTITEDANSRIWVGSNGNGVFTIQSDSIYNFLEKEGLLSNYCYSLICDDQKNIWVGHKVGLSRIRTSNFSVKPLQHIEGITDRYQFNPNAIIKDSQGKIWFGSDQGMVSYDPSMEYSKIQPPVLAITSIWVDDIKKDISDRIIVSPGNHKIKIDFLGISLREPELVAYQYKLEGYDQWSEITNNTSITFPRLTEGEYTFILRASSGEGAVSEKQLINIIIKKPVWKKWWFFPATGLLLVIMTFIYIKRHEYKFLAEKKILEEKVRVRTYEIQCQKKEIEMQMELIHEKNTSITSSINYASNIQKAVLPPLELLDKLLPDNFILNNPKDIVSGDFYWIAEKDNKIVFALADCTGHGVPGAFMSLLGITLLNEIVNINGITESDEIVTNLRERVIQSLQQSRIDIPTYDGMDIVLCVLDRSQNKIQYTGGMSDLVYIRNGQLNVITADRFSVCALFSDKCTFTEEVISYKKGDVFYLFTDGYQDQFGGDLDKKFLRQHFYTTLLEIHKLPMPTQREFLERKLIEWMGDNDQTDDITIIGVRL